MQPYEARMVEVKAKLAGFTDIKTVKGKFFNEFSQKDDETLCITFIKPEKPIF